MPLLANAFIATVGSPGNTSQVSLPLFDPRLVRQHRERFRRDAPPELDYANALYVPSGRWPARGWILLRREDYNQIDNLYRTDFQLRINDFHHGQLTFQNLAITQARCVTRGVAADLDAIYLLEFTDLQGVLWNPWGQFPTRSACQYNVRAPAYDGQYYSTTLNGVVPWTWDTMVGNLWGQMGTFLGAYPGLPIVPLGTPENYVFIGTSAWQAMNDILDYLGLTMSEDLTQAAPYGIVQIGADDAKFSGLQTKYAGLLEDDYEWIDAGSGRVPGAVTVFFNRQNQYYGTEETVRDDAFQWQGQPTYQITIGAPAQYANAPGEAYLWADYSPRFDIDGNILLADKGVADTIALERVSQYYDRVTRGTQGYMRQVYAGALPFYAGSLVDGVCWKQTGIMDGGRERLGWQTVLVRGPQPPFPQVDVEPGVTYGDST